MPRPRLSRRTRSRIDRAVSGAPRLVCVAGRSGVGETTHLRAAFRASNREAQWTTAAADDVLDSVSQYAAVICDSRARRS